MFESTLLVLFECVSKDKTGACLTFAFLSKWYRRGLSLLADIFSGFDTVLKLPIIIISLLEALVVPLSVLRHFLLHALSLDFF